MRRRALALRMGPDADAAQCGTTRWALARALWPSDRDRAKALAVAALEDLRSADAQTELPGEIAAWLSERGVPVDP